MYLHKGQIISKGLLLSSNSPKKRTNKFVFTTTTNSFVHFLGEFEDTKKSFRNYLTFRKHQNNWKMSSNFVAFLEKLNCSYLQQEKDHHEGNCNLIIVSQPRKLSLSTDKQRLTTIKIVGYHLS